jgi:hypothetical protein
MEATALPHPLIKKKVSTFFGENQAKTYNNRFMPTQTETTWLHPHTPTQKSESHMN